MTVKSIKSGQHVKVPQIWWGETKNKALLRKKKKLYNGKK